MVKIYIEKYRKFQSKMDDFLGDPHVVGNPHLFEVPVRYLAVFSPRIHWGSE